MRRVPWPRVAKTVVGLLVVVGLVVAMRNAGLQWQQQLKSVDAKVQSIDAKIAELNRAPDADARDLAGLQEQRTDLLRSVPSVGNMRWKWIFVAAVLYAISLLPPGWLLCKSITSMGESCPLTVAMAAQVVGHLGKYVPGKAMVVLIRVGVLKRHGVAIPVSTVSIFVETFLMMAVGGVIGGLLIWRLPVPAWIRYSAIGVACLAVVPTLPPVLGPFIKLIQVRRGINADAPAGNVPESNALWGVFLIGWVSAAIAWACVAAAFTFLVFAIPSPRSISLSALGFAPAAAICLATVLGFASLLPGGVGVRELVITGVLAPLVGPSHALLAAIAARILFLIVECVCVAACWKWLKRGRTRTSAASTGDDE